MNDALKNHRASMAGLIKCALTLLVVTSTPLCQAVENANIAVDDSGNASIPGGQSTSGFSLVGSGTTGIVPVQIGGSATDDAAGGVMIASVSEMGRDALDGMGSTERLWATPSVSRDISGSMSVVTRKAGADKPDTLFPGGALFDANVNAGYFPFSEGWSGGSVYANGGSVFNEFVLNGLSAAAIEQDALTAGVNKVTIPGVVDTRRQGILLANSAANNNVMAWATPSSDGSSYYVTTAPNNVNVGNSVSGEDFSFVFLPIGTPNMTIARVHTGSANQAPEALISSGSAITMVHEAEGRIRLSIAGQSPSTGSLLLTQHGLRDDPENPTGGGRSIDNVPSFVADGNDWIILSEDLSDTDPIDGMAAGVSADFPTGQDANGHDAYFDLAFIPFSSGPTGPGAAPSVSSLTGFSKSKVIGWNSHVTAFSNGNQPGDMRADATSASVGINVSGIGSNRGDLSFWIDGAPLSTSDGVMLSTPSEGLRDNSLVGGHFEYGLASVANDSNNLWRIATETADPLLNAEHNVDVSVAFFGADSGFTTGVDFDDDGVNGFHNIAVPGANSAGDGVLFATAWGDNDGNFASVSPDSGSGGWVVEVRDNGLATEGGQGQYNNGFSYVYLPYDTQNLVAGRVNADGSLIDSTATSGFTLTRQAEGEYLLVINGKTFDDGMLLLNATNEEPGGSPQDNHLVYERAGNNFLILGLDFLTSAEATSGSLVDLEDTYFSFAFVDFIDGLVAPGPAFTADFDGDGDVDGDDLAQWEGDFSVNGDSDANGDSLSDGADFLEWQRQFTGSASSVAELAMVPEPHAAALSWLAVICAWMARRR